VGSRDALTEKATVNPKFKNECASLLCSKREEEISGSKKESSVDVSLESLLLACLILH
jgi:hypothetical protein